MTPIVPQPHRACMLLKRLLDLVNLHGLALAPTDGNHAAFAEVDELLEEVAQLLEERSTNHALPQSLAEAEGRYWLQQSLAAISAADAACGKAGFGSPVVAPLETARKQIEYACAIAEGRG